MGGSFHNEAVKRLSNNYPISALRTWWQPS
jgi:hypothetical protein